MKPKPWSHTALDTFKTCPRQYHAKYVTKSVQEEKTDAMIWGERVHKAFELRQTDGTPLPAGLEQHEPYMQKLEALPGIHMVEQKAPDEPIVLVDYKTGKPHQKFEQLSLFALHTFAMYPKHELIYVRYYWTKTGEESRWSYRRDDIAAMWGKFVPDLRQFAEAFKTDTWQPRQSGLCNGWCPVKDCEFWKPKRR